MPRIGEIRDARGWLDRPRFAADPHPAYDRPPLSKGLWKGKTLG